MRKINLYFETINLLASGGSFNQIFHSSVSHSLYFKYHPESKKGKLSNYNINLILNCCVLSHFLRLFCSLMVFKKKKICFISACNEGIIQTICYNGLFFLYKGKEFYEEAQTSPTSWFWNYSSKRGTKLKKKSERSSLKEREWLIAWEPSNYSFCFYAIGWRCLDEKKTWKHQGIDRQG